MIFSGRLLDYHGVYAEGVQDMLYTLEGRTYDLVFTVRTMELIQDEFGDVGDAVAAFRTNRKSIKSVKTMFKVMANAGEELHGREMNVTGEELNRLTLRGVDNLSQALSMTLEESLHSETTGGNEADEEKHDVLLEMIEAEKNA